MARDDRGGVALRPEIELSWRRAELLGVDRDAARQVVISDVDQSSRLMVAARPVLDQLMAELSDEPVSLVLGDRDCRVVYQRAGVRPLTAFLESRGVTVGVNLEEGVVGTNGLGTPFELGSCIAINGAEHYLTSLKSFSCYGHPIRHPLTRRIEGVLDITMTAPTLSPLVAPLISRAVQEIEARIIEGARAAERRLFLAFQSATRKRSAPVAVLGGDVVLANRACLDQLGSTDPTVLRVLMAGLGSGSRTVRHLDLGPWGRIRAEVERIADTADGVLVRLDERKAAETSRTATRSSAPEHPTIVTGEPGTGRTREAHRIAGADPVVHFDALDVLTGDRGEWLTQLAERAASAGRGALIVENIQVLDPTSCTVLRRMLRTAKDLRVVLTSAPLAELAAHASALAALCGERVELAPLRERVHELPTLLQAVAAERGCSWNPGFSAQAMEVLANQPWSGNITELVQLVDELRSRPLAGRIGVDDLPRRYRSGSHAAFSGRQRAERAAIVAALSDAAGNKRSAAQALGISRTTLYRKMRDFDVPDEPHD